MLPRPSLIRAQPFPKLLVSPAQSSDQSDSDSEFSDWQKSISVDQQHSEDQEFATFDSEFAPKHKKARKVQSVNSVSDGFSSLDSSKLNTACKRTVSRNMSPPNNTPVRSNTSDSTFFDKYSDMCPPVNTPNTIRISHSSNSDFSKPLSPKVLQAYESIPPFQIFTDDENGLSCQDSLVAVNVTGSSRRSSENNHLRKMPTIKVPPFESKMSKLSPIPLALSPYSLHSRGSAISIRSSISSRSMISETSTIFGPEKEQVLSEKMRIIVESFRSRAKKVRHRLEQPPTPTEDISGDEDPTIRPKLILDDFTDSLYASKSTIAFGDTFEERWTGLLKMTEYVDPRGYINIG